MTTVTFRRGYVGLLTGGQYYAQGESADLSETVAAALFVKGVVDLATPPVEAGAAAPSPAAPVVVSKKATKRASKKAVKRDE